MLIKPMQNTVKHVGPDAHVTLTLHDTDGLTFDLRDRGTGCRPETLHTGPVSHADRIHPSEPGNASFLAIAAAAPSAAPSPSTPTPAPAYTSTDTYRHENQDPGPQGAAIARTAKILFVLHGTTPGSFRSGRRTEPSRRRSGWW